MKNSPDKAVCKKKWAICKADGPLGVYAELLEKILRRHFYPCSWIFFDDQTVQFIPDRFRPQFTDDFPSVLALAVRTVNADKRVIGRLSCDNLIYLDGPHLLDRRGNLKKVKI